MINEKSTALPNCFRDLTALGSLTFADIKCTADGFFAVTKSISNLLRFHGITTFPNEKDEERLCDRFFDDWYLYAVQNTEEVVYGLYKMREQERDSEGKIPADGDIPGVTVSFVSFHIQLLLKCIREPNSENRQALGIEINRVVAYRKQRHDASLKKYFVRTEAEGSYLIAKLYVNYIASLARENKISVPERYLALYQKALKSGSSRKITRIPNFLSSNNEAAGRLICDHSHIFLEDPTSLTKYEQQAILATHTGNVSFHSFAAEVQYHARFLVWYAKIPIPFLGRSIYDSAVRADMTIDDKEFEGPVPFYRMDSKCVRRHILCHDLKE